MATSEVSICNRALQIVGSRRITSLTQNNEAARACSTAYEPVRDSVLRAYRWNFALKRTTLAPDTDTPDFDYDYQFTLPPDCLRPLPGPDDTDWSVEDGKILTNAGAVLYLRYIARVEDPGKFDANFAEMLAAKLGEEICEPVTQSNAKKDNAERKFKAALAMAKKTNAFEKQSDDPPPSSWETARL